MLFLERLLRDCKKFFGAAGDSPTPANEGNDPERVRK